MMYKSEENYESDRKSLISQIAAGIVVEREKLLNILNQSVWVESLIKTYDKAYEDGFSDGLEEGRSDE